MRTPSVCREYFENVLDYLQHQGISASTLTDAMGTEPAQHLTEWGRYPLRLFEIVLDVGSRLLADPHLGLHAGVGNASQPWGLLTYLAISAPTNREAVMAIVDHSRLLIDLGDLVYEPLDCDLTRLRWDLPAKQLPSRHVVEFFFASWYWADKEQVDRWCREREIYFTHNRVGDSAEYRRIFGAPVHFNSAANSVVFESSYVDIVPRYPHPEIYRSLLASAEAELATLHMEEKIVREVTEAIRRTLPEGLPKLDVIAEELNLTPRTLQRRLYLTNNTFKGLVELARRERSVVLIRDETLDLPDIAAELGFNDQSAFQKAFKRWFGQAPGRYRDAIKGSKS
ncbi:AraC family transcriptional regulator [Spongiibacter nanhainus]|nr:AraC family transcriptional regulator [Spongiibacter nanhainus]